MTGSSNIPAAKSKLNFLQLAATLLFLALFAFPLFPLKVTNGILMLLSLHTIIAFIVKPFPIGKTIIRNLIFIIPFLPYLAEFLITSFDPTAHFELEKKLLFFTAPLVIPVFLQYSKMKNHRISLLVFSFSVCLLCIYSVIALSVDGISFTSSAYKNGAYLLRENFEKVSGLHPTYYSLFALTSACFLFFVSSKAKKISRIIYSALSFILIFSVLFLAVRIAFITGIVFLIIWIIRMKAGWVKRSLFGISALAAIVLVSIAIPSLKNRMNEIISWRSGVAGSENTVLHREAIWDCSLKVFSENIFLGTGSRNFQQELNTCYATKGLESGGTQSFNPHNQYLSIGINYGLFMLIIFIAFLFIIFRRIFKMPEGIFFGTAILIFFLSESMLERQMGVYFFGMMALLLYNIPLNSSEVKDQS